MVMRIHSRENNSWALAPATATDPTVGKPVATPIGATPVGVGIGRVLTVIGLGWSLWDWYHRPSGNLDDFKPRGPTLEEQVQILEQEAQRLARSPDEADQAMARVLRGFLESFALMVPGLSVDNKSIFERSTLANVASGIHPVVVASATHSPPDPAAGDEGRSSPDDWAESAGYLALVSSPSLMDEVLHAASKGQKLAGVPSKELQIHLKRMVEIITRGELSHDDLVRLKALATWMPEFAEVVAKALDENKARLTEADLKFLHEVPNDTWPRMNLGPLRVGFTNDENALEWVNRFEKSGASENFRRKVMDPLTLRGSVSPNLHNLPGVTGRGGARIFRDLPGVSNH